MPNRPCGRNAMIAMRMSPMMMSRTAARSPASRCVNGQKSKNRVPAKMTEKIRRPNFGTLEIELTIDDPKVYTKLFTVNLTESLEADTELVDEFCLEGEKDYERLQRSRGK